MRARLADTLPLPSLSSCAQRVCWGARHAIAARSGEMPRARVSASPLPLGCLASGLFAKTDEYLIGAQRLQLTLFSLRSIKSSWSTFE